MHIYHYAAYEVSAVRRLSTRHDTRQDEVDELLRNEVFVDLYQIVRHGLRIGEDSYSIKTVEHLYRPKRTTEVATAVESIVQYARWIESKQARDWKSSPILKGIRDYNEDDCKSTAELLLWLRKVTERTPDPRCAPDFRISPVDTTGIAARGGRAAGHRGEASQAGRRGFGCSCRLGRFPPPGGKANMVADV